MVKSRPKLQNMMAVDTYKNKAKGYVSQICASFFQISVCPFIKEEIAASVIPCDLIVKKKPCIPLTKKKKLCFQTALVFKVTFPQHKYRK